MSEAVTPNRLVALMAQTYRESHSDGVEATFVDVLAALRAALEADPELVVELGAEQVGWAVMEPGVTSWRRIDEGQRFGLALTKKSFPVFAWPARDDTEEKK